MTDIMPRRAEGPAGAAVELEHAPGALAAQPADPLHRRAGAVPIAQPRRLVAGDQPRPHDQRRQQDVRPRQHPVLHDHDDLRVARDAGRHLGRHRRRQGAGDEEQRRGVGRRDGGASRRPAGPRDRWVSRVFASSHQPGTAYVAKNGYRHDDFAPYLFRTTDFGATWTSIGRGLPDQPINVVWQDRRNPAAAVRGQRQGRLGVDRRRRALGADEGQHAERARARPAGASPRAGSRRGHLRPGDLHHERVGAPAVEREGAGGGRARVRHRSRRASSRRAAGATTTSTATAT